MKFYEDSLCYYFRMFSPNEGRSLIIRTGVEFGGQPEWDFAMTQYVATGDTTYLTAMCNSREATRINRFYAIT